MVPLLMVLPHLLQRAMVSFYVDETGCSHGGESRTRTPLDLTDLAMRLEYINNLCLGD